MLLWMTLMLGCGAPAALDQPAAPPDPWPIENLLVGHTPEKAKGEKAKAKGEDAEKGEKAKGEKAGAKGEKAKGDAASAEDAGKGKGKAKAKGDKVVTESP